jgi:hypothetical protein
VVAQTEIGVDLEQALVNEETLGEGARERSAEEACGDNAQRGVGRSSGEFAPRGFLAVGKGEG